MYEESPRKGPLKEWPPLCGKRKRKSPSQACVEGIWQDPDRTGALEGGLTGFDRNEIAAPDPERFGKGIPLATGSGSFGLGPYGRRRRSASSLPRGGVSKIGEDLARLRAPSWMGVSP